MYIYSIHILSSIVNNVRPIQLVVIQNIQMQMPCHTVSIAITYSSSCDNYKSLGNSEIIANLSYQNMCRK